MNSRLDLIKKIINAQKEAGYRVHKLNSIDMEWLIEQAEKVEHKLYHNGKIIKEDDLKMKKYTEIKGKVVNRSFDPEFDTKFYKALEGLEKNAANREKEILENVNEIYIEEGNDYLVANVYSKDGKGFEFVIEHEYRKPGHISG